MKVSRHAARRMKERCGVGKKSAKKQAKKIFQVGIKHSELEGNLTKWVDGIYLAKREANNIRLYGCQAYLFCGENLITVINIPTSLQTDFVEIRKKRIDKGKEKEWKKLRIYQ